MVTETEVLVVGQGLAGTCLAWRLEEIGVRVVIIDEDNPRSSSLVAAGLVTPISGRRLTADERYEALWTTAVSFYRRIESTLSVNFFSERPAHRYFQNEAEEQDYEQRSASYGPFIQTRRIPAGGFEMWPAGRLNTSEFLAASRNHFQSTNRFFRIGLNLPDDLEITESSVVIRRLGLKAAIVVFCQGAQGKGHNPWFPEIPDTPVRGDILDVKIPGYKEDRVVHKGIWLAPAPELGDHRYLVGSTYDREHPVAEVSEEGREYLLAELSRLIDRPVEVMAHRAAVRPSTRTRNVVSGFHHKEQRLAVLNGFGSKGSLFGPTSGQKLANEIQSRLRSGTTPPAEKPIRITDYVKDRVAAILKAGDFAIDATAGNGHDTIFLAKLVGAKGRVVAFDIQQAAIERTAHRIQEHGLKNVELVHDSHERIGDYIKVSSPKVVMFNLGYLPGGDKSVVTQAESTVIALQSATNALAPGSAIAVTVYRGHEHGQYEYDRIYRLCQQYRNEGLSVEIRESDRAVETSPVLFFIER